jgi:hypothetical protein
VWPAAEDAFSVLSWLFGTLFSLELLLKIAGLRWEFVKDWWNWLDTIVVLLWVLSELSKLSSNVQFIRILRVARILRLVRVLKLLKKHRSDGLFMMATALTGSVSATVWCFVFFMVVHILLALAMNQFLYETYFDVDSPEAHKHAIMYEYFGSFSRAFLTQLEITFGNFIQPVRVLTENVHEAYILYAVVHKTVLGFAVVGVLNAVFVQETLKAASLDDNLMVRQQIKKMQNHEKKMRLLFEEADRDGDGTLDMDEWMTVCQDDWVKVWLSAQDIKASDARSLFELIDDGDGRLTAEEIVSGTAGLKGASAVMKMLTIVHRINASVNDIRAELLFSQLPVATERM